MVDKYNGKIIYNGLRENFIPLFETKCSEDNSRIFLNHNTNWGLHYGIERQTTNGLGYKLIRDKKEKVKTSEDLQNHLGKMDEIVREREYALFNNVTFALIRYVNKLEKELNINDRFIRDIHPKIDEIYNYFKDESVVRVDRLLNYFKGNLLNEKLKKEEVPKEKVKKKRVLERIMAGFHKVLN